MPGNILNLLKIGVAPYAGAWIEIPFRKFDHR